MGEKVYGHDLDKFTADEIVEKIGIAKFKNDQLLEAFLEVLDDIRESEHEKNFIREQIYLTCAPIAYEICKRFYGFRKEISHPSIQSEYTSSTIQFWTQPASIWLLYETMIEDGYYQIKVILNPLQREKEHACP